MGVNAGSIAATSTFVETYHEPPGASVEPLKTQLVVFGSPDGDIERTLVTGQGAGLVDVAVIPHLGHRDHPDASRINAETWAAHIPAPIGS
ncbi:MAG TPA: hypothetical protein VI076_00735 [Actinopolymorphaceae bacterium]